MDEIVRAGTVILPLGDGMLQVGSSPGYSFVLTNMTREDERWLRALLGRARLSPSATPPTASPLSSPTNPSETPVPATPPAGRREFILDLLRRHGLLLTDAEHPPLSNLHIRLFGLDRVGVPLVRTLLAMGVRHLDLRDHRAVSREVEYLFPPDFPGLPRVDALRAEIGDRAYLSRQSDPDLVVSVENRIIDHARAGLLLSHDTAHLPIIVDDRSIQVGPIGIPSLTCCYLCLDFHQTDYVPRWPSIRAELNRQPVAQPSPALAGTAASLAAMLIEALVSADPSTLPRAAADPSWYAGLSWRVHETGVDEIRWRSHPSCRCQTRSLEDPPPDLPRTATFRRAAPQPATTVPPGARHNPE